MSVALMIDIETLALTPDAHVVQVGYTVGNWLTKQILVPATNVWLDDADTGYKDMSTIRWWMNQSDAVRRSVWGGGPGVTRGFLHADLTRLVAAHSPDVWASPAMFDLPILTAMFKRHGLDKPWHYRAERDLLTLRMLFDPSGALKPPANDLAHDAAADAAWQLQYLFNLMDKIRGVE